MCEHMNVLVYFLTTLSHFGYGHRHHHHHHTLYNGINNNNNKNNILCLILKKNNNHYIPIEWQRCHWKQQQKTEANWEAVFCKKKVSTFFPFQSDMEDDCCCYWYTFLPAPTPTPLCIFDRSLCASVRLLLLFFVCFIFLLLLLLQLLVGCRLAGIINGVMVPGTCHCSSPTTDRTPLPLPLLLSLPPAIVTEELFIGINVCRSTGYVPPAVVWLDGCWLRGASGCLNDWLTGWLILKRILIIIIIIERDSEKFN